MKPFDSVDFAQRVGFVLLIGTRNRVGLLRKCLESVMAYPERNWRIVVIDAGSTDGTIEYLRTVDDQRFSLVEDGKKMGQAKSLNRVLNQIDCEFVSWISDDNVLIGTGILDALEALKQDPSLGMLGLKVKDVSGIHSTEAYIGGIWPTGVLNINQGVIRYPLFKSLGFFDETYGSYGIDSDLTTRVLLEGYRVALTRKVAILHDRNHSDLPGAFTSEERVFENQRAKEMYAFRYAKALRSPWDRFYLKVARYIWWRLMKSMTLKPYRHKFTKHVLGNRGMHIRCVHNVIFARWISLFDFLIHRGKRIYLVQKIPLIWRLYYRFQKRVFPQRPSAC